MTDTPDNARRAGFTLGILVGALMFFAILLLNWWLR